MNTPTLDGGTLFFLLLVFAASLGVSFILIPRVPPRLHTPLMSMTNGISAVTLLGALVVFGLPTTGLEAGLGGLAVLAAAFNAAGGFALTDRMLRFFKR